MSTNPASLARRAASRFVVGFDGTAMTPELREMLDLGVGGVILFRRNVVDPWQVAELNAEIVRATKGRPIFISVDQEGGPVQRLRAPFTEFPPHGVLGKIDEPALTQKVAAVIARELRALGFNTDYAPLADVDTNPQNPVIGIRSFGSRADLVQCHVSAWIDGMQGNSVLACAKHFPGHGDTNVDSHHALPVLAHPRARIDEIELVPFVTAIEKRVGSIMTAHVVFESLDPGVPATLSKKVLTGLLRDEMGFKGLIISDDLEMKAIADTVGVPEAAVTSIEAGADILLICRSRERILASIEKLTKRMEKSIPRGTAAAEERIAKATRRFLVGRGAEGDGLHVPPGVEAARKIVGSSRHRSLAAQVAEKAAAKGIAWAPPTPAAASPVSTT